MSADIEINDGRAMFLGREAAWHRLGTVVGEEFGVGEIERSAPEILMPVYKEIPFINTITPDGVTQTPLRKTAAIVREDGKIVGEGVGQDSYGIVQSRDLFEFGQELAGLTNYPLVSAGNIREGSQFFFTYATGDAGLEGFPVQTHLTMVSSHDGTLSAMALYSSTIVVCANTLAMALHGASDRITFKHTSLVEDRMAAFLAARKGAEAHSAAVHDTLTRLSTLELRDFNLALDGVLPVIESTPNNKRAVAGRKTARHEVTQLYTAPVVGELYGTALGFVQAVNTFENWNAPVRGRKGRSESQLRAERQFDQMVKGAQPLTTKAVEVTRQLVGA